MAARRQRLVPPPVPDDGPSPAWCKLFDVALIETILHDAARQSRALSYAETLYHLGYAFSRPKMRALCAALDAVDRRAQAAGQPPLAVLVVRQSDGLPGDGWWAGKDRRRYRGSWTGAPAAAYVRQKQHDAYRHWRWR